MPAFKSLIQADKLYLRDATAVSGHLFVGFLCLYLLLSTAGS